MPTTARRLSLVALAVCAAACSPVIWKPRNPAPPPDRAVFGKADVEAEGVNLTGRSRECWTKLRVCDFDGQVLTTDETFPRHEPDKVLDGITVAPGRHRLRIESGIKCTGEVTGGDYAVNFLAAGLIGVVSLATDEGECPAMWLEFEAEPGKTYLLEPVPNVAPGAPWAKIRPGT